MIIVNFSTEGYRRGQQRLQDSLNGHKCLMFSSYQNIGSPTHQKSPYHFKIGTIEKGFQRDNIVIWADASLYLVGDITKVEKIIEQDGYFMEEAGHYVQQWTNAKARSYFNLRPEENYTMFSAGFLGLNKGSAVAMEFFRQWKASAEAGCFVGDWKDHRHDMACASIIASRLGMKYQRGGSHLAYVGEPYGTPEPGAVFHLAGMP